MSEPAETPRSHPRITLEQWLALTAVVEAGSYARAAERLHKSQSTVTYAVQQIERLLDVKVFQLQGRKAQLTAAGQVLYRRARTLVDEAQALEQGAGRLAQGWEPEIAIAVEVVFPTWLLLDCLKQFFAETPDTRVELHESVLGGTDELLNQRRVDFAIASAVPRGFIGDPLMQVRAIAAAAPSHPLHQLGRALTWRDLRRHRHLLIRDTGSERTRSVGWQGAEQRLTVSAKATSIAAATRGMGFAWFAEEIIRPELERGELKALPMREGSERYGMLYLVFADNDHRGRAAARLAELLRAGVKGCPGSVAGPPGVRAAAAARGSAPEPARAAAARSPRPGR